eukprot:TRINITY_DN10385_c0_g1_i1.p1 TRINITY_DN10385_c0_g1~~TRINITY_DN10385_c0_g1_i1.p1  ORF type:complete len:177 (+),score=21.28 TRINITY_DN10385_c0_g1_i1:39-569(+)
MSKCKLLPHEQRLVSSGELKNVTHTGSSSIWLSGDSSQDSKDQTRVYRPMGDIEVLELLKTGQLPSTQPYQAIIEGDKGREYAEKYLTGKKWVDTAPTTVVEFVVPCKLVETLMAIQHKAEDGCLSMGLGNKAGNGLPLFNKSLQSGESSFRIVKVKRSPLKEQSLKPRGKGKTAR